MFPVWRERKEDIHQIWEAVYHPIVYEEHTV